MFDILTDVWAHPGAVHAPVLPFNISSLSADEADGKISVLHKYGYDSLLLICDDGITVRDDVLKAVFSAAAKRYMLIFVDESVVLSATSCTDSAFVAYNPMLTSHRLALASEVSGYSEVVAKAFVKTEDGKLTDVLSDLEGVEDASQYEEYTFVMTDACGLDILCPETCEMLVYGAYETFISEYKECSAGTLAALNSSRLACYIKDELYWSYDMLNDFYSVGGDIKMLVSLFVKGDKRSEKEGRRLYNKALSARLESSFCRPVSEWCGKYYLGFMGDVPFRFASNCGRRFTLPKWTREGYDSNCSSDHDIVSGVRFLGDIARGEGFTGVAYKSVSADADSLVRELNVAFAGSAELVELPELFADTAYLEAQGIGREDMRKLCLRIKRLSTLGTSCGSKSSTALLCDDSFIPYQGAEKLRTMGVDFNFISKAQIMERGHTHHGELLIDKFRYSQLLIDSRVRLEPAEVMKIGEFASYGGKMYRGCAFGDFASKNIEKREDIKNAAVSMLVYETYKCSCPFKLFVNRTDAPVMLKIPDMGCSCYVLDTSKGKKYQVRPNSSLRVLPYGVAVLVYDMSSNSDNHTESGTLSEIYSLADGDNLVDIKKNKNIRAEFELDEMDGNFIDIEVNGKKASRILYPPYRADLTSLLVEGENNIMLSTDKGFRGAVLRIISNEI